jgi:hypothetical protein
VTGPGDKPLDFTVVGTVMRVDLPKMLMPGEKVQLKIAFSHNITDAKVIRGRGGYEYFPEDGNRIYEIAQWFPRLAAYTDYAGWRHDQYVALGEFTLEFGDYVVRITVPDDHVVAASGELKNPDAVLTPTQRERLAQAAKAKEPMFIVTPEEAKAAQSKKPADRLGTTKTWEFHAKDVRDFAFATSRKFIWDAVGHPVQGRTVMAMSYYPNEAEPLWSKYSTASVAHTLNVYGKYTFDYPYPVAISVNGPIYGMEYPMICFNGPRPDPDGTYSDSTKYGLISVVIHEVGHNWFPMIVNSDERRCRRLHDQPRPAPDHDRKRIAPPIRQQRLRQTGDRAEHPPRNGPRPRTLRFRVQGIRQPLAFQTPNARRFLPHHGRRLRTIARLVLARLVFLHRPCRYRAGPFEALPNRFGRPRRVVKSQTATTRPTRTLALQRT